MQTVQVQSPEIPAPAALAAVRRRYVARRARVSPAIAAVLAELAFPPRESRA